MTFKTINTNFCPAVNIRFQLDDKKKEFFLDQSRQKFMVLGDIDFIKNVWGRWTNQHHCFLFWTGRWLDGFLPTFCWSLLLVALVEHVDVTILVMHLYFRGFVVEKCKWLWVNSCHPNVTGLHELLLHSLDNVNKRLSWMFGDDEEKEETIHTQSKSKSNCHRYDSLLSTFMSRSKNCFKKKRGQFFIHSFYNSLQRMKAHASFIRGRSALIDAIEIALE